MKIHRRKRPKPHIDMTPLIDCVFTLTIILLLAASFQSLNLLQLSLPQAVTRDEPETPEILVTVDQQGNYFLDAARIDPEQLEARLKPRLDRSKRRVVTFRGDQRIPYQWFVKVVDASRASGAIHIAIIKEDPKQP